jgi:endoglucanase
MRIRLLLSILGGGCLVSVFFYTRRIILSPSSELVEIFDPRPFPHLVDLEKEKLELHPPFSTRGRNIIDATGRRVKLASVNWYGASDELFIPGGLEVVHRSKIAEVIKMLGFNSVRLPYSDEMVMDNPLPDPSQLAANEDLIDLRALDVYIEVVKSLTAAGIAVIINNHITQATWCCGINLCDTAWYNNHLGPICRISQSEEQWLANWGLMMENFVDDPLVIGADLRNEPRGIWGTMPWNKWATAAEKAGNQLLKLQPNWLIFVEGVSSSNDLSDVRARPIKLDIENCTVYSAHVYSWSGGGSREGMYAKRPFDSFAKSMVENWGYLLEEDIAPVWVGEFGGPHIPNKFDLHYWMNLVKYLKMVDADFGYWAINPRKPHNAEKEDYGLVEDDWQTPVLDYRIRDMLELIRQ